MGKLIMVFHIIVEMLLVGRVISPIQICKDMNEYRKFAININVEFKTPEQLFQGVKQEIVVKGFNAKNLSKPESIFKNSDAPI